MNNNSNSNKNNNSKNRKELSFIIFYAIAFYTFIIHRSLHISRDHYGKLYGFRPGWLSPHRFNDVSDSQWRNFHGNLPILTAVFGVFPAAANTLRTYFNLKERGMSIVWLFISFIYLFYLHGDCIVFVVVIASLNFLLVKMFARTKYFSFVLWIFNIFFFYVIVFMKDIHSPRLGIVGPIWTTFGAPLGGIFALILECGIEVPENMRRCVNNCYNLESFGKNWHASFNKWLMRKLLSWAWLTCLFFILKIVVKSAANTFKTESAFREFAFRELSAIAGAITITCLMVANLVGYFIGPAGINWLISRFLKREGLPVLGGMFVTFYVGTKLTFDIQDAKQRRH